MPFDALFLKAVTGELTQKLFDSRIDKIHQPTRDSVILHFRSREGTSRLLICANPSYPRIHLTRMASENPQQPPMFCMLLRKHLLGARLLELRQAPMERCVSLRFSCMDELGQRTEKQLVAELMGRTSNLILVGEDGRVLDCLRRVDLTMSERRPVLPGLRYELPPRQDKCSPEEADKDLLAHRMFVKSGSTTLDRFLLDEFFGLSPLLCRELSHRCAGLTEAPIPEDSDALAGRLVEELEHLCGGPWKPTLLRRPDGRNLDFSCISIEQYEGAVQREFREDFSTLLDDYYSARDSADRLRQKSQAIVHTVAKLRDRTRRKLENQRKELAATYDRERLRQLGDIVTANLYQMERGQMRLSAVDFYDPEMKTIDITLNPAISPQQNAAKFYKDYAKAKNAEKYLTEQIKKGEQELEYFLSVLDALGRAETERDILEIREELLSGGYLHDRGGKKRMKLPPARPMAFLSSDGFPILVGRNNRQNDELTLRTAAKNDLWLHAQKIPGSHVIILCDGQTPPDSTVTEAMELAAWYSQAREGQGVPVDCTQVRYVKKPNGAKPGMVIYDRYHTGFVVPDPKLPDRLRLPGK